MVSEEREEAIQQLMDGFRECLRNAPEGMSPLDVLLSIKVFEMDIQDGYGDRLGLEREQLDDVLLKLVEMEKADSYQNKSQYAAELSSVLEKKVND